MLLEGRTNTSYTKDPLFSILGQKQRDVLEAAIDNLLRRRPLPWHREAPSASGCDTEVSTMWDILPGVKTQDPLADPTSCTVYIHVAIWPLYVHV